MLGRGVVTECYPDVMTIIMISSLLSLLEAASYYNVEEL